MKKFFLVLSIVLFSSVDSSANDGIVFKCRTPDDIIRGVGCYTFEVLEKTGQGLCMIIKAPFKSKIWLPEKKRFLYTPPKFNFVPGSFKQIDRDRLPPNHDTPCYPHPQQQQKDAIPLRYLGPPANFAYGFDAPFHEAVYRSNR